MARQLAENIPQYQRSRRSDTLMELRIGTEVDSTYLPTDECSLPLRLQSFRPFRPAHESQNCENQEEKTESATGEISPASAVRPDRQYAKTQHTQ